MNVAFRVDASPRIGSGHVMRCLTLADELRARGARTRFVSRHLSAPLRELLQSRGHESVLLPGDGAAAPVDELAHAAWLGTSQRHDATESLAALADSRWDALVVDHYALDSRWQTPLRAAARTLVVIDDLADRSHDCDVLIDNNHYEDAERRYDGRVPSACQRLLGPRYALLRAEFRELRRRVAPRSGKPSRLLVFFGGMDADDYTGRTLEAFEDDVVRGVHVDVIIGGQHPRREFIESECARRGFELHVQTPRMAELMAAADLSVGAGGTATWERCCLGLPTLAFSVADNQRQLVSDGAAAGLLYAFEAKDEWAPAMQRHLRALFENPGLRHALSVHGMAMVDGRGALRVAALLGSSVEMRPAAAGDSRNIFEWRNHPSIRAVSRNHQEIAWPAHQRWFDGVLASADRVLLLGHRSDGPVGVVRFDIAGEEAEVSIYLVPGEHEPGLGGELLHSAEQWLRANRGDITRIRATVMGGNERSSRLFLGSGYRLDVSNYLKRFS